MIATIVMVTRMTQPECAIEARHVSQIFGWWVQGQQKSHPRKITKSPTNKNARLLALSEKSVGIFFQISDAAKFNGRIRTGRRWRTLENSY